MDSKFFAAATVQDRKPSDFLHALFGNGLNTSFPSVQCMLKIFIIAKSKCLAFFSSFVKGLFVDSNSYLVSLNYFLEKKI